MGPDAMIFIFWMAKEKSQRDSRRGQITFKIKPQTHQRLLDGTNKTLCTPGLRERSSDPHKRLSQTCLWVSEGLLWRNESAVARHGHRSSGSSSCGRRNMWPECSWRRSSLAPLWSHRMGDSQIGEQSYQGSSQTAVKVLGPRADFPTCGSSKGTEYPQGIWLSRSVGFDYRTSKGLGKQTLGGHRQKPQDAGERSSDLTRDSRPCLWVQESPWCYGLTVAAMESGALITAVLGAAACGHKSIWRRSPLPPLPHHSLASGQTTGREHSSTHPQNYLLVYYYFLLSFSFYLFFFHPNHCGWISTTGPYVHKRPNIISPINHKEMQIQTTMKSYHPHVRMAIIKNTRNTYMWNLEK